MASQTQQLENPAPPTLGYPTEVYERRHFNENNGSLTIYFKKPVYWGLCLDQEVADL